MVRTRACSGPLKQSFFIHPLHPFSSALAPQTAPVNLHYRVCSLRSSGRLFCAFLAIFRAFIYISFFSSYDVMVSMLTLHPRCPGFNQIFRRFLARLTTLQCKKTRRSCNVAPLKCCKPVFRIWNVGLFLFL